MDIRKNVLHLLNNQTKTQNEMTTASELIGYAEIAGTKRLCNVYEDGTYWMKNYIGEFILIENPIVLTFTQA